MTILFFLVSGNSVVYYLTLYYCTNPNKQQHNKMAAFSPKVLLGKLDEALAEKNAVTNYLDIIEKKTNVKKRYLVLGKV